MADARKSVGRPAKPPSARRAAARQEITAAQLSLDWLPQGGLVAGVDEAGRGPLAGPVFACAVILDDARPVEGLADSKKLSPQRREQLYDLILARALCCSVGQASVAEIDQLNILQATLLAMQRAVAGLRLPPKMVLVDGNRLPVLPCTAQAIVGGDQSQPCISAASIVAKVSRDRWCRTLHAQYPAYGFDLHKGYGTRRHLEALAALGPCPEHRRSFAPVAQAAMALALKEGQA